MIGTRRRALLPIWVAFALPALCALAAAQQTREAEIRRLSQQAQEALAQQKLDEAASALEKLTKLTPEVPEVFANLGMVYYTEGRMSQAAENFQYALRLNPRIANVELMLGICYAEIGRSQEALPILEPAFRHLPDAPAGRLIGLELQRAYIALKRYDKADEVSDELLRRYPDDPEILYHVSRLHADRSYQIMVRLFEVARDSVWVILARAAVHENLKQYDLAIGEYRMVLQMDPRQLGVHYRLGRAMLLASQDAKAKEEALNEFQQELSIDPQNSNAWYEMGEVYRREGQLQKALELFGKAVEFHPDFDEAEIALGRVLINLKKPQDALPHLLTAVRVNPENELPHFLLASVYKALGDATNHQKELALFQKSHAGGRHTGLGTTMPELAAPEVTRQTMESEKVPSL
jgi:tetratricopeptide (TPR) repeat protein